MNENVLHIALADNDKEDRLLFQKAIEILKINTELQLFNDGQQLMDYMEDTGSSLPHMVFLDLNMPIKNGRQCLQEIRSTKAMNDVIIAIFSTSSSEKDIEEIFIYGANIYINKPNTFKALKKAIAKAVEVNWQYHTSCLDKNNFLLRL